MVLVREDLEITIYYQEVTIMAMGDNWIEKKGGNGDLVNEAAIFACHPTKLSEEVN